MVIVICAFCAPVNAQQKDALKYLAPYQLKNFGKNAERSGDVFTAIDYYEEFHSRKPGNPAVLYKLGELYHASRNYEKARDYYQKAFKKSPKKYKKAQFYYAQMLKSTGEYDKAIEEFDEFRRAYRGEKDYKEYRKLVRSEVEGCEAALKIYNDPLNINIENLNTTINGKHVDVAPFPVSDKKLVYTSLKVDTTKFFSQENPEDLPVRQLYVAEKEGADWNGGKKLPGPFNIDGVETVNGVYSKDRNRFYFCRCVKNWQNKPICAIYVSRKVDGEWQEPEKLPPHVNDPNYTSTQPAIGVTAKYNREVIYFVSDRPDGRGGMDLWYTIYKESKDEYSNIRNLGLRVNTPGDELSPFYDYESRSLFFSSTGHAGLGGFDIYEVTGQLRKWTKSKNIGYPLNSSFDDLYYSISPGREDGFFVSNRPGGYTYRHETCCDDIYYYKRLDFVKLDVKGQIFPAEKGVFNWAKESETLLSNSNDSVAPLEGAILALYMIDEESEEPIFIARDTTEADGAYHFNLLPEKDYTFEMEGFQYFNEDIHISTKMINFSYTIEMPPIWVNILPKQPIVLENIYYEFNKAELSDLALESIDKTLLAMMNEIPNIIVEVSSHTDSVGNKKYNKELSQERAENVVNYLINKGISSERLVARGYGSEHPVAPNSNPDGSDNPAGREKNRRTEFKIIGTTTSVNYDEDEEF